MEEEGHFTVTFRLKDRHESLTMKISLQDYDRLSKSLLNPTEAESEFIEINREDEREFFGWKEKSLIVHRSQILEITFGFQGKRNDVF